MRMNRERLSNLGSDRESHYIKRRPAVNIHHATRMSVRLGLPLNRMVTINFSKVGCRAHLAGHQFRKLLTQRFAPWLRRTASKSCLVPPTYVWTIESAGKQMAAHWLVHVPAGLHRAFEAKIDDWLTSLFGERPEPSAVHIRRIHNLTGARRYILKGIDPAWADHLKIIPIGQGKVIGKRSGFSKNLGPTARERGGYRPKKSPFRHAA